MKPETDGSRLVLPVSARDHVVGPAKARVTLVEYGDYECPHCGHAHEILKAVLARVGPGVRFVFRNFPLSQIHPHAEVAAESAECAGSHGKFWNMHDALFENQEALEVEDLVGYAEEIGLDGERVATEIGEHLHLPRVREDFLSGVKSGVNGTPTFFINGRRHDGSWEEEDLLAAIARGSE